MIKDQVAMTMIVVASLSFMIWQDSLFAGLFVFAVAALYFLVEFWK